MSNTSAAESSSLPALPKGKGYSWEKRLEVVSRYMLLGNMRVVSEQTGIGYDTLLEWKKSDWWADMAESIRRQKKAKTNDSLTKIIESSLDVMQDRLENGDFILNQKTGQVERKPVSVRDATSIAAQLMQRQIQLEEIAAKAEKNNDTVQETLTLLAREFQKWNKAALKHNAQTIEFKELDDAVEQGMAVQARESGEDATCESQMASKES